MKISRILVLTASAFVSSVALGQTLPPPAFHGQSYWFGPGPTAMSVSSSTQDFGGYAEMVRDATSTWVGTASGGPAFNGFVSGTSNNHQILLSNFRLNTSVSVQPYIYVDGYFGVSANLTGFTGGFPVDLGASRVFILHNCPISMDVVNFEDLYRAGPFGPGPNLPTSYVVSYASYTNPGSYSGSSSPFAGGTQQAFVLNVDPVQDDGILQIDISRSISQPGSALVADTYTGGADFEVTAI